MTKLSALEETMLGPLWARAMYAKKYPDLLNDPKAIEIIESVNYDFSEMEQILGEWRAIGLMIRARSFDNAARDYIKKYPSATIINIGAGLDTTFFRIDNGKIKMYNIDLPDVIDYRENLLPSTDRNKNIAKSAFDYDWITKIDYTEDNGIFIIAGGFVYYFNEEKISNFLSTLADDFTEGEIIFDAISSLALNKMNKKSEKAGSDLRLKLAIDDPFETIPKWSEKLKIKDCFVIGDRTSLNKDWKFKTKIMNKVSNWLKTARIINLKFI
ncbi:MAG: class I SAM-dependent methyltransferase [Candidatus Lokiarchaeota archaeon]|nr:class I SAM-dependent methyltransferase [Candidatus Lokiarchaeota archaeon]MBD3199594.1 class I SAM-dependent methyltransferase [Candidatus Lokiarchaeota archaeon]